MDTAQLAAIGLLVLVLVLALWRRINIGTLGFAAIFILILVSGETPKELLRYFPAGIFTLLVGVSFLFTHLERSGALGWFVGKVYTALGDRTQLIPWTGFVVGAAVSTAGAMSTAPITLLVPTIAAVSRNRPALFFISEAAAIIGANVAGLSPLNPSGGIIYRAAAHQGTQYSPWLLWAIAMVVAVMVVAVLQLIYRPSRLVEPAEGRSPNVAKRKGRPLLIKPVLPDTQQHFPLRRVYALCSALAVAAFVYLVVFVGTDVGLTAVSLSVVLMLIFPGDNKVFIHNVPWYAVMVLCGLLTFVGGMQAIGTMSAIQHILLQLTSEHLLLILVIAYMTSFLCNIESSTVGVMGLVMPMLMSIFGYYHHDMTLIIAAVAVPATLSVLNPIHAAGTLMMGYTEESRQNTLFRRLLFLSLMVMAIVPALATLLPALFGQSV